MDAVNAGVRRLGARGGRDSRDGCLAVLCDPNDLPVFSHIHEQPAASSEAFRVIRQEWVVNNERRALRVKQGLREGDPQG